MKFWKIKCFLLLVLANLAFFNLIDAVVADHFSPRFVQTQDQSVKEGEELVFRIRAEVTGPPSFNFGETPGSTYYSLPKGNNAVLRSVMGDPTIREFHWTPRVGWRGVYQVRFTVFDGTSFAHEDVLITVNGENHAPTITAMENKIVVWGDQLLFKVPINDIDIHDDLQVTADLNLGSVFAYTSTLPAGVNFQRGTWVFTWVPDATLILRGDYIFRFCVTDNYYKTACQSMTVTVADSYPIPVLEPEVNTDTPSSIVVEPVVDIPIPENIFKGFPDVKEGGPHYDAIAFVGERGIFQGDAETGNFAPNRFISRAEMAKVLLNGFFKDILEAPQGSHFGFNDLEFGSWYMNYIYTAFKLNIMNGTGSGKMEPLRTVNKVELLKMFLKAAGEKTEACTANVSPDVKFGDWYCRYVKFANLHSLMGIDENGNFNPAAPMTRADVAELFYLYNRW